MSSRPPRNVSCPKRCREGSRGSKLTIGRARTSILTGGSATRGLSGSASPTTGDNTAARMASTARRVVPGLFPGALQHHSASKTRVNALMVLLRRPGIVRASGVLCDIWETALRSRVQPSPHTRGRLGRGALVEQLGELFGHGAAEFLGVDDRHRAAV